MKKDHPLLPEHIAIIMDGNGRWAKKRFLPRAAGHRAGVEAARRIVKACAEKKIRVLTLFAFSSENWQRPEKEVTLLMKLFVSGLRREMRAFHENNIKVRFIGNREKFHHQLREHIIAVETLTQHNTGLVLIIAADYGGQWDICEAVKKIANQVVQKELHPMDITPQHITDHLSFADLPNPDLFIRTSGEVRISNFMLWQLAYAELYFTEEYWPDFTENSLEKALLHFSHRERRFGLSGEQLAKLKRNQS